jgi:helix-turn-helix protein
VVAECGSSGVIVRNIMALIAALSASASVGSAAAHALRAVGTVALCTRVPDLVSRVDEGDVSAVVLTSTRDSEGRGVLESTVALRGRHPLLWIVQYGPALDAEQQSLLDIAAVSLRVIWVASLSGLQSVLARALAASPTGIAPLEIQLLFEPYAPRAVREILAACAANTRGSFLMRDAEARLGVAGRTIRGRLSRAGWPPPRELIAWCRLLHATFLLDVLSVPAKRVAHDLGYSSAAALQVSIRRHLGLTSGELLERGGYSFFLQRFERALLEGGAVRAPDAERSL